jgi:hypothetical protein
MYQVSHSNSQHMRITEREVSLPYSQEQQQIPIIGQMNPLHTLPSYFLKTYSNIILRSTSLFS